MSRMFAEPLMSVVEGAVVFGMLIFVAAVVEQFGDAGEGEVIVFKRFGKGSLRWLQSGALLEKWSRFVK